MKKIMFNNNFGLTEAVLTGKKTMMRSICKYDRPNENYEIVFPVFETEEYDNDGNITSKLDRAFGWLDKEANFTGWNIPKYRIGEIVAVAQSYKDANVRYVPGILNSPAYSTKGWNNKMFVRADLMPHQIQITNIIAQKLQDISDEDCLKEGIYEDSGDDKFPPSVFYEFYGNNDDGFNTPREAFAALIDKVSGKGTWERNPYVFGYEFKLIK